MTMKKAMEQPLIDVKELERELRENGYPESEIEELLDEANYINKKTLHSPEEVDEFYFNLKEKVE